MKSLKRYRLLACLVAFYLIVDSHAKANPPSEINIAYDQESQHLSFSIRHLTKDPRAHYIRRIIIFLNDKEWKVLRFSSQMNTSEILQTLPLELQKEDVVKVLAICNEAGRKEAIFKME